MPLDLALVDVSTVLTTNQVTKRLKAICNWLILGRSCLRWSNPQVNFRCSIEEAVHTESGQMILKMKVATFLKHD